MPLTPVDLIKNHLLSQSSTIESSFDSWSAMLTNLGDSYAVHERFLRQYYNAFKAELPEVSNATVATKAKLIRIYETVLADGVTEHMDALLRASAVYGRITCVSESDNPTALDHSLRRLMRAQGAPSYVLVMWLLVKRQQLDIDDSHIVGIVELLTSFFVRRNLTGLPQTYILPKLFMDIIAALADKRGGEILRVTREHLLAHSASDDEFRARLEGPIYDENTDVARFILTVLSEDAMTKETRTDLWVADKGHYVWTIEHILPQGANLPEAWKAMLGGAEAAAKAQEVDVHRLGNLTITAYNSTLSNRSFQEKRDRQDSAGRWIGYRNGLALNKELALREGWNVDDIAARTTDLAARTVARFPLA